MASKKKGLTIKVAPDDIVYTSINKSKDNYNSARLVAKVGEKAYMNIGVEWEGETVPSFAMELMGTLTASQIEPNTIVEGKENDYLEYEDGAKKCGSPKKPKKKMKKEMKQKEDSDLEDE